MSIGPSFQEKSDIYICRSVISEPSSVVNTFVLSTLPATKVVSTISGRRHRGHMANLYCIIVCNIGKSQPLTHGSVGYWFHQADPSVIMGKQQSSHNTSMDQYVKGTIRLLDMTGMDRLLFSF